MRSLELVVEARADVRSRSKVQSEGDSLFPPSPSAQILSLFVHGVLEPLGSRSRSAYVLGEVARTLVELANVSHGKRIVRLYEEGRELCVERLGPLASLSVYRCGSEPDVLVYNREVSFAELTRSALEAVSAVSSGAAHGLAEARESLLSIGVAVPHGEVPAPERVQIEWDREAPLSFSADFLLRPRPAPDRANSGEHADMHALLVRGPMGVDVRGRSMGLGDAYPFLFAERLLFLVRGALASWERAQPSFMRLDAGGIVVGLRSSAEAFPVATLTLSNNAVARGGAAVLTFPELSLFDVVEAALGFGRALVRGLLRRDRAHGANVRLSTFRRELRQVQDALREVQRSDERINPSPESYRAYVEHHRPSPKSASTGVTAATRLRYVERWRALVPSIDLRATFLCGDRLVVGGATETYCLERTTGTLLWRHPTQRATSVVTPTGIARIAADGAIEVLDFGSGEVSLRTWISPRVGGSSAGAVVSAAGLPRLLVLTEGARHLVAIDLTTGEARWRYAWGRGGTPRLKRCGKLMYIACGNTALTALDVQTGAIVWRARDRLRFCGGLSVEHDSLFAVSGGVGGAASLHALDPYAGSTQWVSPLGLASCTVEGAPLVCTTSVVVSLRDRRGLRLAGFDKASGAPLFVSNPIAPVMTSWLPVDDLIVGNSPAGDVLAVDGRSGSLRWRHTLEGAPECDIPRRLEPVLRSGALYIPAVDVPILRPSDGGLVGTVGPCDAIADLLRVDERCDVYIAEESGHMVSFGVGPRLSLVPS